MPTTPSGKEPAARNLGEFIRTARGHRKQEELAVALGWSNSKLSRFEHGDHVPDLADARQLDVVLGTDSLVADIARDILFNPTNATLALPRMFSQIVFQPMGYVGPVYVHVAASVRNQTIRGARLALHWGTWRRVAPLPALDDGFAYLDGEGFRIDQAGIALAFAKQGPDSTPLRVRTSEPLLLSIASGLPLLDGERVLDANDGWTRHSHEIPTASAPDS